MFRNRKMLMAVLFALLTATALSAKLFRAGLSGFGFGIGVEVLILVAIAFTFSETMSVRAGKYITAALWSVGMLDSILILMLW